MVTPYELKSLHEGDRFSASQWTDVLMPLMHREDIPQEGLVDSLGTTHAFAVTEEIFRWGKVDTVLKPGEQVTVSLWCSSTADWAGWDQNSEVDWEDVYASPLMINTAIPANNWVLVRDFGTRKVVVWWCATPIRCCLAQTHPGYNIVFEVYAGTWNSATDNWDYDTEKSKAKDLFYADPEIVPAEGATGVFISRPSDEHGIIYMAVSGDCDSPGSCHGS